jgi:hypothetical protein
MHFMAAPINMSHGGAASEPGLTPQLAHNQQSQVNNLLNLQLAIANPQSAIGNLQSAICNLQSTYPSR